MRNLFLKVFVCYLWFANFTLADNIRGIDIDFIEVGHAGNLGDSRKTIDNISGFGAVNYKYRIGQYEITNAQWNTFTTIAGAPIGGPSNAYGRNSVYSGLQQPVDSVSWYEALQFCNYLTSGDKSKGAYRFGGDNANAGELIGISRASAEAAYGTIYVLPNFNEWYKAAFFKPDGSGYSLYTYGTDTPPVAGVDSKYYTGSDNYGPWNVGSGTREQNGTFDMLGNVWEWNEDYASGYGDYRVIRGCSFYNEGVDGSGAPMYNISRPTNQSFGLGFRIVAVPEPATLLLLGVGGMAIRSKKFNNCMVL